MKTENTYSDVAWILTLPSEPVSKGKNRKKILESNTK